MLSPYRVLDLTDRRAALAAMMLADLGAEVTRVEPPGPAPSGLDALRDLAYNRAKRRVTLDLATDTGRAELRQLAAAADLLFENDRPGGMAARALGFDELQAINPRLVYVAISPFGQDGPYAGHAASDITLSAMSGQMAVNGDADRAPVRITVPQAWLHASAEAAVGALVGLQRRTVTGEGQFVDVSVQASLFLTALNACIASAIQGKDIERNGTMVQLGLLTVQATFPCADGYVVMFSQNLWPKLVSWMVAEGDVPPVWNTDTDWRIYFTQFMTGQPVAHSLDELLEHARGFLLRHKKHDLFLRGLADGVFVAPANTIPDVLALDHLHARRYWQTVQLPDGREALAPGPWVKGVTGNGQRVTGDAAQGAMGLSHAATGNPQPTTGEGEGATNGLVTEQVRSREPSSSPLPVTRYPLPFEGLKVADFSWVGVGPLTAKYLADHGATVVRVETSAPPDILRVAGPFKDGVFGPNRTQFFGMANTSKQSIALNLKEPAAREVAKRLIAWADVYLESFTPGTITDLGLGYGVAREINPSIIMVSTCLMGQTGPAAGLAGYGAHAAAMCGFVELTGWPDRAPSGPYVAYTDTIAPRFLVTALMAAIDHRRRTGEGRYMEQSQMESALHFLAPEILDYQATGRIPRRLGNASPDFAPHGVYPCKAARAGTAPPAPQFWGESDRARQGSVSSSQASGAEGEPRHGEPEDAQGTIPPSIGGEGGAILDQWIAIAVETDAQWRGLRRALGEPAWAADPALESAAGRLARQDELDAHLCAWTSRLDRYEAMARLQAEGVPAGVVQRSSDALRDPQLAHRRFFRRLMHGEMGDVPYEGHVFRIRGYDNGPRFAAPCLGEHSIEVLRDVLGMTDDEIAEVAASGALV